MQIIFLHIPKTAGTSVREALFRARPQAAGLCDYGSASPATSPLVKELRYGPGGGVGRLCAALAEAGPFSLSGHIKVRELALQAAGARLLTVLRDPAERVVSHYLHARHRQGFEGDLMSFAAAPEQRNVQARFVGAIPPERWLLVARHDRLAEHMARLSDLIQAPVELEHANPTPWTLDREITAWERRRLRDLNDEDVAAYEDPRSFIGGRAPAQADPGQGSSGGGMRT